MTIRLSQLEKDFNNILGKSLVVLTGTIGTLAYFNNFDLKYIGATLVSAALAAMPFIPERPQNYNHRINTRS